MQVEAVFVNDLRGLASSREELLRYKAWGIDSETTGFDAWGNDEMTLLQLSPHPGKSFVFDVRELCDPEDFRFFKDALADPDRVTIFQNAKFDLQFLRRFFGEKLVVESLYDTYIASILLARGDKRLQHGLGAIAQRELDVTLDKSLQKSDFGAREHTQAQIDYAARDAAILHSIRDAQKTKIELRSLAKVARLEFDAIAAIADTEYAGFHVDRKEWLERCSTQQVQKEKLEKKIVPMLATGTPVVDLWGDPVINLGAPAQVLSALKKIGVPLHDSADEDALALVKDLHQVIPLILEFRKVETALKKFGPDYLKFVHTDSRIHADFQQIEAPSGRMSCRHPNLQQLPAYTDLFRNHFKAPEGRKLIVADYSQIELRIMAKQSGDPVLVQAYMNDQDIHNVTAHHVLGEPLDNPDPIRRKLAKNCNFGIAYGVSPEGFAVVAGIPVYMAEQTLTNFWRAYRVLGDHLRKEASRAADQGIAQTMSGRTAILHVNPEDQRAYSAARRLGRNFGVQGTGADILKEALYLFRKASLDLSLDADTVNIVHDELVVDADEHTAGYVAEVLEEKMIEAAIGYLDPIPVKVGVKVGDVWSK